MSAFSPPLSVSSQLDYVMSGSLHGSHRFLAGWQFSALFRCSDGVISVVVVFQLCPICIIESYQLFIRHFSALEFPFVLITCSFFVEVIYFKFHMLEISVEAAPAILHYNHSQINLLSRHFSSLVPADVFFI